MLKTKLYEPIINFAKINILSGVITMCTKQWKSKNRMKIFTIQRVWRQWALPVAVEVHNVEFIGVKITRVWLLCFLFEYEVQNIGQEKTMVTR